MSDAISTKKRVTFQDLSGQTFGRWTVLRLDPSRKGPTCFFCRCICGKEKSVRSSALKKGLSRSCGCINVERLFKHGRATTKEYFAWGAMLDRCYNERNKYYDYYGGRGIMVCDRWREDFANFFEDMGKSGPGLSLDRIDNSGNYEPGNCRWTTRDVQGRNRRGLNLLTHLGETLPLSEWATRTGMPENTIRSRLKRGWSDERTLTEPVGWNPFKGPKSSQ